MKKIKAINAMLHKVLFILTTKQKVLGVLLIFVTLFSAAMQTLGVAIISPLVSLMSSSEMFLKSRTASYIINFFKVDDAKGLFVVVCTLAIVLYFFKELVSIFHAWFNIKFTLKVERELAIRVFTSYIWRDYDFFANYGTAKILRDVRQDTTEVNNLLRCFVNLLVECITVLFILLYILLMDWHIALCIGFLSVVCAFLSFNVFKKWMKESGIRGRKEYANTQKILLEAVEGIKEVQVMDKQNFFLNTFSKQMTNQQIPRAYEAISAYIPSFAIEGIFVIGMMLYMIYGVMFTEGFFKLLPIMASALVGAIRLLPSLGKISSSLNYIPFYMPALESVYGNVKKISEYEASVALDSDEKPNDDSECILNNELKLEEICWSYPKAEKRVLDGLNMYVKKGESIGIIGHSGSGKSTLADIILGLHRPQQGTIYVDDSSYVQVPKNYKKLVGYVSQNIYLFDGTIRENIAFGVEPNEIDDNEIHEVLKQAQLEDFVNELKDGLDTVIGERGVKISGGQRQRLAIARALYRKPQVLILDEATSALDNETESTLMKEIEALYGKMTMIIIAHRLSTVKKCNRIYEIRDGKAYEKRWEDIEAK
ncbi:ABC-type bacteriocin/lantibiotic exporter, contains an N-terminal double-glycine peptidase domain [Butyrivibrio sp. INlla18]|uniref:ABC transporter ATP-binding protein n=1 Tax=Butyrivibrio sp. INlla18 TaxID=1520806 RepID=UPI000889330D|nr:ATP-binding cassette domain-containing protein [Butyrivibrio sp. INlla18]SDA73013.1 ABC-type bacteriocin/lantibiotic exporter, contains an N-terminal double-glycine peptidase domain [Butyrivibrio sp. INlla18]